MYFCSLLQRSFHTFALIATVLFSPVQAQEIGNIPIRNFTSKEYGGTPQSSCIIEDPRGVIYVANNKGVLEYDGLNWRTIIITDEDKVSYLTIDTNGTIFVGGLNRLGYLWPNATGQLEYRSLLDFIDEKNKEFGKVEKIFCFEGNVYFQTSKEKLIIWNGETMTILGLKGLKRIFLVNDQLYAFQENIGLSSLIGNKPMVVIDWEVLKEVKIREIMTFANDQILVLTAKRGLFTLIKVHDIYPAMARFNTEIDGFLYANTIEQGLLLRNGNISIGTNGQGIVVIDDKGRIIQFVNKQSILQDASIAYQYQDSQGSLWLALHNGIAKLDISAPIVSFLKNIGLEGTIEKIVRCNGLLYVAGNLGVYLLDNSKQLAADGSSFNYSNLKKVLSAKCWDIIPFKTSNEEFLLVAATEGLFQIDADQKVEKISSYDPNVLYRSPKDPARVYVGLFPGFASIYYENGRWADEAKIQEVDENIYRTIMDNDSTFWLGSNEPPRGTMNLALNRYKKQISSVQVSRYDTLEGLPTNYIFPVKVGQEIVFTTIQGIYSFNKDSNAFSPYTGFGTQFTDESLNIHRMRADNSGNVWMCTINKEGEIDIGYAAPVEQGGYHWVNTPFKGITEGVIMSIHHEENGITWLGGPHGLFRYNAFAKADYKKEFNALVRRVETGHDKVLFGGTYIDKDGRIVYSQPDNMKPVLNYEFNSMGFQFAAHSHEGESVHSFTYQLEGFDEEWSPYKDEASAKFTNLMEGNYTFRVKGKNLFGYESSEAAYAFTILPPWYRTVWAYIGYGLLLIGLIYGIVRVSIHRLEAAKKRLEKIVKERTAEVVKQGEEIEEKNRDITDSINYAQRIQAAILPPDRIIQEHLKDSFVLYKPKDIVAGDFYWMEPVGDSVIFAVADCTGHGVPGAMLSMLCNNALNRAVREYGLSNPGQILDKTRSIIIEDFDKSDEQVKDGMDISLCSLNGLKLEFAGAFNPMWVVRKGDVIEIKADRQPIGNCDNPLPFTTQSFDLEKGDLFYVFSDGYVDQFGGEKGKKLKSKKFRSILLDVTDKPMADQKELLDEALKKWRGDLEQVDDVCMIGVRV